jgi:hypothetical protein
MGCQTLSFGEDWNPHHHCYESLKSCMCCTIYMSQKRVEQK